MPKRKDVQTAAKSISEFYQRVHNFKNIVIAAEAALEIYRGPHHERAWLCALDSYLNGLSTKLKTAQELLAAPKIDNSRLVVRCLEGIFENEALVALGKLDRKKVRDEDIPDPFNRVCYVDFSGWQDNMLSKFIEHLGNASSRGNIKQYYELLKFLYKSVSLKDIFNGLLEIVNTFKQDSGFFKAYARLAKVHYAALGVDLSPVPLDVPARPDMDLDTLMRNYREKITHEQEGDEAPIKKKSYNSEVRDQLIAALKKSLGNGDNINDLKNLITRYTRLTLPEDKALCVLVDPEFGPYLVPVPLLEEKLRSHRLNNLGGLGPVKTELGKHFEKLTSGKTDRKHILLYGPSGTGKTSLIYSFVNERNMRLVSIGRPEELELALHCLPRKPCVLYVDDKSTFGNSEQVEIWGRVLDGKYSFPPNVEVIVTTNMATMPDKIIQRFGVIRKLDLPNEMERGEIINIYAKKYKINLGRTHKDLIDKTAGHSGREIKSIFEEADEKGVKNTSGLLEIISDRQENKPKPDNRSYS